MLEMLMGCQVLKREEHDGYVKKKNVLIEYQFTEAAGEVYALCTQEISLEQEAGYTEKEYTGETVHELLLQWGDTRISLYKPFRDLEYADMIEEPLGREFGDFLGGGEIPGFRALAHSPYVCAL